MKEKDLTSNLLLKLRKIKETWWYKIPDPTQCPKCGIIGVTNIRPFDIVGVVHGVPVALEIKRSAGIALESHQAAQLRLFTMGGGFAFKVEKDKFHMMNPDGTLEYFGLLDDVIKFLKSAHGGHFYA